MNCTTTVYKVTHGEGTSYINADLRAISDGNGKWEFHDSLGKVYSRSNVSALEVVEAQWSSIGASIEQRRARECASMMHL